jgi:hypothetical protein
MIEIICFLNNLVTLTANLGVLVVTVLATGPTGYSVAGSNPTEDGDKNP